MNFALTRELELEKAVEDNDKQLAEELSEALYLLQRLNGDKLGGMISSYKPQAFGRNWAEDADYAKLSKELTHIAETYNTTDFESRN